LALLLELLVVLLALKLVLALEQQLEVLYLALLAVQ
jgi:hypothetical protein